jgi:hypothetical protein
MPDEPTELAVGESLKLSEEGDDLCVETTRSEEHLFTTTYRDADTGTLRLALQVDITTGSTAIDPRSYDATSASATPIRTGGPPSTPVNDMNPPRACIMMS